MAAPRTPAQGIDICSANPRYWRYKGRPVLLLGGSVEDNLFQIPDLAAQLDALTAAGGNYVRCTMSSRDKGNAWPFQLAGGFYDLDKWDRNYWLRFATFLEDTRRRDIIVQIELWATFDFYRDNWRRNPFNPRNNVNYTPEESGLPLTVDSHPVKTENPFFRSVPDEENLQIVLEYQERFVDRVLGYALQYDNVLYCMDNETSVSPAWGAYWADYVRTAAAREGKGVHVTEMWDPHDLSHPMHAATFDHPETYSFVDVSQNNHQSGRQHYANAFAVWRRLADAPRPMNNVKVYGADGGRFGDAAEGVRRFWRNIFCGAAAVRFHRPPSGIGLSERARRQLRSARDVTGAVVFYRCEPRPDLLEEAGEDEAYCLAEPGRQYAVYFPNGGGVCLDLSHAMGTLDMRWYDVDAGRWGRPERIQAGRRTGLRCPGDGAWAVVIR